MLPAWKFNIQIQEKCWALRKENVRLDISWTFFRDFFRYPFVKFRYKLPGTLSPVKRKPPRLLGHLWLRLASRASLRLPQEEVGVVMVVSTPLTWVWPPSQDASDHQDYYMFSRGFRPKPSIFHWHPGRGQRTNVLPRNTMNWRWWRFMRLLNHRVHCYYYQCYSYYCMHLYDSWHFSVMTG